MIWNFRVLANRYSVGYVFEIVEVYYDDEGNPVSCTGPIGISSDDPKNLPDVFEMMRSALDKPILDSENWPNEFDVQSWNPDLEME